MRTEHRLLFSSLVDKGRSLIREIRKYGRTFDRIVTPFSSPFPSSSSLRRRRNLSNRADARSDSAGRKINLTSETLNLSVETVVEQRRRLHVCLLVA